MFLPHPRVKVSIAGSLRDREVACSASDRQGSNFESCVWRTVSSQSSHHPQEVLLAQFSLYVHKGGLKPDSFHFIYRDTQLQMTENWCDLWNLSPNVYQYLNHILLTTTSYTGVNKNTRLFYCSRHQCSRNCTAVWMLQPCHYQALVTCHGQTLCGYRLALGLLLFILLLGNAITLLLLWPYIHGLKLVSKQINYPEIDKIVCERCSGTQIIQFGTSHKDLFQSFGAGNCVSNSSFKWIKNIIINKQFSRTRVRISWTVRCWDYDTRFN